MAQSNRGFANMVAIRHREIASLGGRASGGNFANDRLRASLAGKKGAANQPLEAKRLGGKRSHINR